jgi:hypothetical protein
MKKLIFIVFFVSLTILLLADEQPRGLTSKEILPEQSSVTGRAQYYFPEFIKKEPVTKDSDIRLRQWTLVDSINFDTYVHAGKYFGVGLNCIDYTLEIVSDHGTLITASQQALEIAPAWMRTDLANVLSELSEANQQTWAGVINDAEHPYIDEIAYSIAHSSPVYLSSEFAYPQLFIENAWLIYEHDIDLSYVEIMDYGTPYTDENYYSTTKYWKVNEAGEMVQVEVPRDIYYMYLVHPKNTDEIPAYIDPDIMESNSTHQNNIVGPTEGEFWRDYLYNYNDEGYPKLKYYLQNCDKVWNSQNLSIDTAMGALTTWLGQSLTFTSDAERPHQPVRIYKKHIGRCGEHADMRSAIARLALIPCTSILTVSGDHTWNEFWDERWVHWDGGTVDYPLLYENGWGTTYGSVFEIRSDGVITPVTDIYSEGSATITIYVLDANDDPVDGARIVLGVMYNGTLKGDNVGYTDNEGKYVFIVGEGRDYYAQMTSPIGDVVGYQFLVENALDGGEYVFALFASGEMPVTDFTEIDVPDDEVDDYKLVVEYSVNNQIIHGNIVFDDIDYTDFYDRIDEQGEVNFFMTDLLNFFSYADGFPFEAFNPGLSVIEGYCEFNVSEPLLSYWYAFFDNKIKLNNPQRLVGSFSLYDYNNIGGMGIISGTVIDAVNSQPVEDAIVTAGIYETITNIDGEYSLEVYPNNYIISCTKEGFLPESFTNIDVENGEEVNVDFTLTEISYAPSNVVAWEDVSGNAIVTWDTPEAFRDYLLSSLNQGNQNIEIGNRELTGYNIYIGLVGTELDVDQWSQIGFNVTGNEFLDVIWPFLPQGIYKYAVRAVYSNDNLSSAVFSNEMYRDMFTTVNVYITTNCGDEPTGALVTLSNQESSNSQYVYSVYSSETGEVFFEQVWKGVYTLTVDLNSFDLYIEENIEINENIALNVELQESITAVTNLSVLNYLFTWENVSANREFQYYNIFLDDMGTPFSTTTEDYYDFWGISSEAHIAGISAVYSSGESGITQLEFEDGSSIITSLAAYYPLEGNADDMSGNNYNGNIIGDVSFIEDVINGQSAWFDGIDDYIDIPGIFPDSLNDFTVLWWNYPLSHTNWNQQMRTPDGWGGFVFHTTNEGAVYVGTDVATRLTPGNIGENTILIDEWQMLTFTFDNGIGSFYKNGYKIASRNNMGFPTAWNGFYIGNSNSNTIDGFVDEVRLWERAVGTAEIEYLYIEFVPFWGIISGTVIDAAKEVPVEGALIKAGMFETVTNAEGYYEMDAAATMYDVICTVEGYDPEIALDIIVTDGETVTVDFIYPFTGSNDQELIPSGTFLFNNYPNPFNPSGAGRSPTTTISFSIPEDSKVVISIYNIKGQLVRTLVDENYERGLHNAIWNGKDTSGKSVSNGIYFYNLKVNDKSKAFKKMLLLK